MHIMQNFMCNLHMCVQFKYVYVAYVCVYIHVCMWFYICICNLHMCMFIYIMQNYSAIQKNEILPQHE